MLMCYTFDWHLVAYKLLY